jgi:hypothetical protein
MGLVQILIHLKALLSFPRSRVSKYMSCPGWSLTFAENPYSLLQEYSWKWFHVINGTSSMWNYESQHESNASCYLMKYLNASFQCPPHFTVTGTVFSHITASHISFELIRKFFAPIPPLRCSIRQLNVHGIVKQNSLVYVTPLHTTFPPPPLLAPPSLSRSKKN